MTENILVTSELTKIYGNKKALNKATIHIRRGEIYGLIGRNGAGKTTLLKILSGLSFADSGNFSFMGKQEQTNSSSFERIGVLIENPGIFPNLTALDNLMLKCTAYGRGDKAYAKQLLAEVGLGDVGKKKTGNFSLGMKQRLGIALAMVGEPDLVLLDEPINGLDPQGIIEVRDMLLRINRERRITILISSHILEELSKIATRYGIIHEGSIIEEIDREKLLEQTKDMLVIEVNDPRRAVTLLEEKLDIRDYQVSGPNEIKVYRHNDRVSDINRVLNQAGLEIPAVRLNQVSLEDYFIRITGGVQHA